MQRAQMQPDIQNTRTMIAETDDLPVIVRRTTFFERKLVRQVLPWAVIAGMFVLWELAVRIFQIPLFVLPAPTAIFEELWRWRVPILENSWQTLMTTLVGFAFAIVIGAIGGVALGSSRVIYDGFYPALIAFNSVPKVAVIPVLVIWFGIGTIPAVITAFLLSFFPILVNVATGIATVEPELRDVLRALGASKRQVIMKVGLPRAMPYFFAIAEDRDDGCLRRFDRGRDRRCQCRHRPSDAGRIVTFRGAAGICWFDCHRPDGRRDVRDQRRDRTAHDRMGDSRF